ncbi:MAG TPA: STAS domain-containing protein [Acidimicrobiales bacterium]
MARSAVVEVGGDIDFSSEPMFEAALAVAGVGETGVVVDLEAVDFIGAGGVAALQRAATRARLAGRPFALRHPSPTVRRMLDVLSSTADLPVEEG